MPTTLELARKHPGQAVAKNLKKVVKKRKAPDGTTKVTGERDSVKNTQEYTPALGAAVLKTFQNRSTACGESTKKQLFKKPFSMKVWEHSQLDECIQYLRTL